jgi:TolB-like protein/DNA-binding winged helix-turn-helix (wHTH) protein/Flp pilus assembly protein TadD
LTAAPTSRERVRFGPFDLDCQTGELRRNGSPVKLQPQPAKILAILVTHPGETVSRQELCKQVWGSDTFVDFEQGLNFAIRQIRSVLEDEAEHPRYLETIPKRGYRFIATVEDVAREVLPLPAASSRSARSARIYYALAFASVIAAAIGIVLIFGAYQFGPRRIESIAVLPLRNLSTDPEYEYFTEGMTDELITHLAKIGRLRVISHTSVNRYKDTKLPVREIAKELGVDAVIEGTVLRSGDRIRITAQLIDARTDRHLWAESYERDIKDVLALQDDVSQQIVHEVGLNLTSEEQARLTSDREVDPVAHEAYLKGNVYADQLNCTGTRKAVDFYQQALARDPNYAPAYAGLGNSHFRLADWGCALQAEHFAKAKEAAARAVELDDSLSNAHILLGKLAFYHDWEWEKAEQEYRRVTQRDSNNAWGHASYAVFLVAMGRRDEGLGELNKARQLDPVSEYTNMLASYIYYQAHDYDRSIEQAKKTIELYPHSGASYYWLGQSYEQKGLHKEATEAYMTSGTFGGGATKEWMDSERKAFEQGGIAGYWGLQFHDKHYADRPGDNCWRSLTYAHMGDKQQTLKWLDFSFEHHCDGLQFLRAEPIYDMLREDPRYRELVARMRL